MFYILLLKSGTGISASYSYLTDIAAGSGEIVKKSFPTISDAQAYVQQMIETGNYGLNDFIVVKGVVVSATMQLTEET